MLLLHKRRLSNEKIQYLYCTVSCTVSGDNRTITIFHLSVAQAVQKHILLHIIRTYLYMTCNKKTLLVKKNILAYCRYSPTSPFFFLHSEHKHCSNAATNWSSENARRRMVISLRGSVGAGTKED
jgi:hypothetical protein